MRFFPQRPALRVTDARLQPFLEASSAARADIELVGLMEQATPLIVSALRNRSHGPVGVDAEDAASEARAQVAARLQHLRFDGAASPGELPPAISDFSAYVSTVAYNAWAEILRQRNPGRAKLLNRLRYLLEKRTTQFGFALWKGQDGETWAGFDCWKEGCHETSSVARQRQLLSDPRAAAAEALGGADWASLNLADLIASLFSWLGGPLKLQDLTDAVARLHGIPVSMATLEQESFDDESIDPHPSPCDELRWKEYLAWLWQATARLTLPQRTAFLLHSHCLQEMEAEGLTSVRRAASALGLAAERMAEVWNSLPLDDLAIGTLLGAGRQQVINWRKAARIQLGREFHQWLNAE